MGTTRRDLVKNGIAIAALGLVAPSFLVKSAYALTHGGRGDRTGNDALLGDPASSSALKKNILVVVQLSGGNDGLGTVIPYTDRAYFDSRPTLAPRPDEILRLTDTIGLHPNMKGFKGLYDNGHMAILQGVGYPNPNRSHFRSMAIWQTARPDVNEPTGWLGRYLEAGDDDEQNTLRAMNVGNFLPRTLWTETTLVPSITNLESYQFRTDGRYMGDPSAQVDAIHHLCEHTSHGSLEEYVSDAAIDAFASSDMLKSAVGRYQTTVQYGNNAFAEGMKLIAQVIAADLGTRIFYISLGGFDTHANQAGAHANLLAILDEGVSAFYNDLEKMGKADQVALMSFSEFGRRVRKNGSAGTDHGTSLPMFVIGGNIKGGVYGNNPNLTDLDNGDLRMQTDFRAVYASVVRNWLGVDPTKIIQGNWADIPLTLQTHP
ncbi:MAG TPA: DUF1501 domain-containing protein [Chloroflexia bacterium]|jgi:uncharacterized protein (DUF1501 family)